MITGLEKELDTYAAHRAELLARALGKFALIKGDRVVGVFDSWEAALARGQATFVDEAFLVKEVVEVEVPETFTSIAFSK